MSLCQSDPWGRLTFSHLGLNTYRVILELLGSISTSAILGFPSSSKTQITTLKSWSLILSSLSLICMQDSHPRAVWSLNSISKALTWEELAISSIVPFYRLLTSQHHSPAPKHTIVQIPAIPVTPWTLLVPSSKFFQSIPESSLRTSKAHGCLSPFA